MQLAIDCSVASWVCSTRILLMQGGPCWSNSRVRDQWNQSYFRWFIQWFSLRRDAWLSPATHSPVNRFTRDKKSLECQWSQRGCRTRRARSKGDCAHIDSAWLGSGTIGALETIQLGLDREERHLESFLLNNDYELFLELFGTRATGHRSYTLKKRISYAMLSPVDIPRPAMRVHIHT